MKTIQRLGFVSTHILLLANLLLVTAPKAQEGVTWIDLNHAACGAPVFQSKDDDAWANLGSWLHGHQAASGGPTSVPATWYLVIYDLTSHCADGTLTYPAREIYDTLLATHAVDLPWNGSNDGIHFAQETCAKFENSMNNVIDRSRDTIAYWLAGYTAGRQDSFVFDIDKLKLIAKVIDADCAAAGTRARVLDLYKARARSHAFIKPQ